MQIKLTHNNFLKLLVLKDGNERSNRELAELSGNKTGNSLRGRSARSPLAYDDYAGVKFSGNARVVINIQHRAK